MKINMYYYMMIKEIERQKRDYYTVSFVSRQIGEKGVKAGWGVRREWALTLWVILTYSVCIRQDLHSSPVDGLHIIQNCLETVHVVYANTFLFCKPICGSQG